MEPKYITLILAYISSAMTSPIGETAIATPVEYGEQYRQTAKHSDGELIFYGPPSNETEGKISPRDTSGSDIWQRATNHCSSTGLGPIGCVSNNVARNDICSSLVDELNGDGDVVVPESTRSLCYQGNSEHNNRCCVSWHNTVTQTLTKLDLATPAYNIMRTCTLDGISGKIRWIWLKNACTSICLSNRPGHC